MQKAVIYNNFFATAGGGERSTIDVGLALSGAGYSITLVAIEDIAPVFSEVLSQFGIAEDLNWEIKRFPSEEHLSDWIGSNSVDLFVNHSFGSYMPNTAKRGLYMVMFPQLVGDREVVRLRTYDRIVCISSYTEDYVARRWGEEFDTSVVVPPIAQMHFEHSCPKVISKEKLILNIGRFNVVGHNKRQADVIDSFKTLVDRGILGSDWSLAVIGRVNLTEDNQNYVQACKDASSGYEIEVLTDVSHQQLYDFYRRAACLWQFTGYGLDYGVEPEHCEHLGLVALDSLAYGVLPVVYERSGVGRMIRFDNDGYHFRSLDMLGKIMLKIEECFRKESHQDKIDYMWKRAKGFSFEKFELAFQQAAQFKSDAAA